MTEEPFSYEGPGIVVRVQDPVKPMVRDKRWRCNACTFQTADMIEAETHLRTVSSPIPHLMYESSSADDPKRSGRAQYKAGRRMHMMRDGSQRVVCTLERPRRGQ